MTSSATVSNTQKMMDSQQQQDDVSKKYQKLSLYEHIKLRPGTYIGDVHMANTKTYVYDREKNVFVQEDVNYVPALYKIIDEVVSNACDQYIRLKQLQDKMKHKKIHHVKQIQFEVNRENNSFSVYNDGEGIEIQCHNEHQIYIPELIFGNLLTGSNYDDTQDRYTIGTNGMGVKLCNIFSLRFEVETIDAHSKQHYYQLFENGMLTIHPPVITPVPAHTTPYTRITAYPDFAYFGLDGWTDDIMKVLERRTYDIAICTDSSVNITFNGQPLQCAGFEQFMDLFDESEYGKIYAKPHPNWEIGVCMSEDGFKQYSFVNGTFTFKGGKHVDYVTDKIVNAISDIIERKNKIKVKPVTIKEGLLVFVKCQIINPCFDSQSKETLTTNSRKFGSSFDLDPAFLDKLLKLGFVDRAVERHEFKEEKKTKNVSAKRVGGRLYGIPKLDDAYEADGPQRSKCTLILTEGDSAKSMAVAGVSAVGRDFYGVFPLKGKMINAREKEVTAKGREQLSKNTELNNLKLILGLEKGKIYTSLDELRYGHVMIMTDQDVDGSHIKGLFMNWIATYWPSLLDLGFVTSMITPIIKATKGKKEVISFYSIGQYLSWKETNDTRGWKIKYYKGLGTSSSSEAKEYFQNMKKVDYFVDQQSMETLDLAFNGDRADDRKLWLKNYDIQKTIDTSLTNVSFEDFINLDLIQFSHYDNHRSIPCVMDGFKPSQRKILFTWFKKNQREEIKVAQFSGAVSELSGYHHGENSLNMAIVAMAQNYVGSNNINLFMPNGQFGTRLEGGTDAASPRYIFTELNPLTEKLFIPADRNILTYLDDDGKQIEPEFYVPIIPMVLVNGSNGIGTGYSTNIPLFNPVDIAENYLNKLNGGEFQTIHPYYKDFKGKIIQLSDTSYLTKGKYTIKSYKVIEITELPIGRWTNEYKEFLESLLVGKKKENNKDVGFLKSVKNGSTETTVYFEIEVSQDVLRQWAKDKTCVNENIDIIERELQLTSKINLTNMHMFDERNMIRKYANVIEIMQHFYDVRYQYYIKRKDFLLQDLDREITLLQQKVRFLDCVIRREIDVGRSTVEELELLLQERQFLPLSTSENHAPSYDYLIDIKIRTITVDNFQRLQQLLDQKMEEHQIILTTSIEDMWKHELRDFLDTYQRRACEVVMVDGQPTKVKISRSKNNPKKNK